MSDKRDEAIVAAAVRHTDEVIAPGVNSWLAARRWPREASDIAAAAGLLGLYCPAEWGGQGLSFSEAIPVYEALGRGDGAYSFCLSMHNICAFAVCGYGSEAFKERWARRLTGGAALANFSLTEPQSGSDAARILTEARTTSGGGYVINGRKAWVSLAGEADIYLVVVRTEAGEGARGAAMVAVEKDAPGLSFAELYATPSYQFLPIGEMILENVEVAADNVILPPGQGLQGALTAIDIARTSIAAGCAGLIETALLRALDYAYERRLFGARQLDLETIRWMLAAVDNDLAIVRLLYRDAAAKLLTDEGRMAAAHAKLFAPDAALRAANVCTQVMGGAGLWEENDMHRLSALAQMLKIVDGTSEIQKVVLGRALYKLAETRAR